MKHYLYQIKNLDNNKVYIGVSKDPYKRIKIHLNGFGNKLIKNDLSTTNNWDYKVLVVGKSNYIYDLEIAYIKKLNSISPNGYNIGIGGEGGNISNRYGELNTQAILTEPDIIKIRNLAASGVLHKDIANQFQVTRENISCIVRGSSWSSSPGPISKRRSPTKDDVEKMKELKTQGLTYKQISDIMGWSTSCVHKYTTKND